MFENHSGQRRLAQLFTLATVCTAIGLPLRYASGQTPPSGIQNLPAVDSAPPAEPRSGPTGPQPDKPILKKLTAASDRIELNVNSSRILTLEGKIPRAQVNNPDVLTVTPLSPTEIQISATQPGVTQLNLWDENGRVYSLDVTVYGDVQELQSTLQRLFPHSSVRALRTTNSLVLTGFVDQPSSVNTIMQIAEDYAPRVVSNISVGGVQQILLNVKVMEVSRTKLRALGFDFANLNGDDFIISSVSGLVSVAATQGGTATGTGGDTVRFGIVDGNNSFFGFLKALRQHDLMKVLAEPKLATVSGRPASFNVGGEFPVLVPQSLGTVSIEYRTFGTQVDFMPLVMDNGNIRLEVRPRVSEIDPTRSVTIDDFVVPGLRVREVDTAVEMKAGQTLAIAGLVQNRVEARNRGLPYLADMPWVGAAFRSVEETNNEIELLILVRPELIDPLDPHEVPHCGPGLETTSPSDCELYWHGYLEVPACNGCGGTGCAHCQGGHGVPTGVPTDAVEEVAPPSGENVQPQTGPQATVPRRRSYTRPASSRRGGYVQQPRSMRRSTTAPQAPLVVLPPQPESTPPRTYRPGGTNRYNARNAQVSRSSAGDSSPQKLPGLIGPVGYDVVK